MPAAAATKAIPNPSCRRRELQSCQSAALRHLSGRRESEASSPLLTKVVRTMLRETGRQQLGEVLDSRSSALSKGMIVPSKMQIRIAIGAGIIVLRLRGDLRLAHRVEQRKAAVQKPGVRTIALLVPRSNGVDAGQDGLAGALDRSRGWHHRVDHA